ncbi:YmfQ family protein [Fusobacterium necrophorum]|uniref:putative phage tail protein n=1 Tax=Fusobacterium necrophorum TaxID=859 RepID=UPI00254D0642|nr:putative phage tail protein [Fusobacterium necrophorum]MDK4472316.1 YmfQ family protein [Fusobacterium necrophorum]MDK4478796.1 YmfQ family protein [Fusobacterium necrophorum]MDK4517975.1 YmfQ family protein [Fusobacterium necrophorum]
MKVSQRMDISIISKIARNTLMEDFFNSLGLAYDIAKENIEGLQKKVFIFDADNETLEIWENFMELEQRKDFTLKDRAERILYTLRSKGIFTPAFLKEQAKIFTNGGEVEVTEDFGGYSFTITFKNVIGIPSNMENFRNMIELNKPAHLGYKIVFKYRTHKLLKQFTHGELKRYTHKELFSRNDILGGVGNE